MLRLDLKKLTVGLQQRHIYRQKNNFDTLFIKPGTALFLHLESTIINTISRGFFYFFFIPVLLQHKSYFQSIPQQQMGMRAPALNTWIMNKAYFLDENWDSLETDEVSLLSSAFFCVDVIPTLLLSFWRSSLERTQELDHFSSFDWQQNCCEVTSVTNLPHKLQ